MAPIRQGRQALGQHHGIVEVKPDTEPGPLAPQQPERGTDRGISARMRPTNLAP